MSRSITVREMMVDLIEDGLLDPKRVAMMCIRWMTSDDLREMCRAEDIDLQDLMHLGYDLSNE